MGQTGVDMLLDKTLVPLLFLGSEGVSFSPRSELRPEKSHPLGWILLCHASSAPITWPHLQQLTQVTQKSDANKSPGVSSLLMRTMAKLIIINRWTLRILQVGNSVLCLWWFQIWWEVFSFPHGKGEKMARGLQWSTRQPVRSTRSLVLAHHWSPVPFLHQKHTILYFLPGKGIFPQLRV